MPSVLGAALPGYAMDQRRDVIEEADYVSSGGTLAEPILFCDKVMSFQSPAGDRPVRARSVKIN